MPPANDNFASSQNISGTSGSVSGTTLDATQEVGEPDAVFDDQSVWYDFTPASTATYQFSILQADMTYVGIFGPGADAGRITLEIDDAVTVATYSALASDGGTHPDKVSGVQLGDAIMIATLTGSTTYKIRVSSPLTSATFNYEVMDFVLQWEAYPDASNDDFADAEVISGESGSVFLTTAGATAEGSEPQAFYWSGGPYFSVWYEWTAPSDGRYAFRAGSDLHDTLIAVYTGASLGSLTPLSKNEDGGRAATPAEDDWRTITGFVAEQGTTYMIQVDSYAPGVSDLAWERIGAATSEGDSTANPIELTPGTTVDVIIENAGRPGTGALPADTATRFAAFSTWTGGDTYSFGMPTWYHITAPADFGVDLKFRADARENAESAELVVMAWDGAMNPRETFDGWDAVAICDYDFGLAIPISATDFDIPFAFDPEDSDLQELVIEIPPGEEAYIAVMGFRVEEWAFPDPSVITDGDYTQFEVPFRITPEICAYAVDYMNPDNPYTSIVGDYVRTSLDFTYSQVENEYSTIKFTWAGAAGQFKVHVKGKMEDTTTPQANSGVWLLVKVNGRPFINLGNAVGRPPPLSPNNTLAAGDDFVWTQYEGLGLDGVWDLTDTSADEQDFSTPTWVVIQPGDIVEATVANFAFANAFPFGRIYFDLYKVCFEADLDAPATSYCTPSWSFTEDPLGDVWGENDDGWGGQRLVADEIWAQLGYDPDTYTPGVDFPWGVGFEDYDFIPLEDGTIYAILRDSINNPGGPGGYPDHVFVYIKKYDPGSNTWTQIDTINVHDPTDNYAAEAVCAMYDGSRYIYFAWWEVESLDTAPSPDRTQWGVVVKRLDTTNDAITQLGGYIHEITVNATQFTNYAGSVLAPSLATAGEGEDIYLAFDEMDLTTPVWSERPRVFLWDGATWTNLNIPAPTEIGTGTANQWEVRGQNSFYDVPVHVIAARPDGPVTDGCTVYFTYAFIVAPLDSQAGYTQQYTVGVGWHDEVITDWFNDVQPDTRTGNTSPLTFRAVPVDYQLLWSDSLGKLVLVFDDVRSGIWEMVQMNDAETQWEVIDAEAPPTVAGQWRQGYNTAAIGPDGEIYRGGMFDTTNSVEFEPKVLKRSPGYAVGYAVASTKAIGEEAYFAPFMFSTTMYRIRIVGEKLYYMSSLYVESMAYGTGDLRWGEGIYVTEATYTPCDAFVPHIYRRVLG